jgi:hypothetical protein
MNVNFNEILNRFKTDKVFKTKVLKSTGLAVGAIVFLVFMSQKNKNENKDADVIEQSSIPVDDYFLADTTNIIDDKNAIYKFDEVEKKDGSEIELQKVESEKNNENADIDAYIKNREKQISRINNYQRTEPERREYNPYPPTRTIQSKNTYVQESTDNYSVNREKSQKEKELEELKEWEAQMKQKNAQSNKSSKNTNQKIQAIINSDQELTDGERVDLRLSNDCIINDVKYLKNTMFNGFVRFGKNRLFISVKSISGNNVDLEVYDGQDGYQGLYTKENLLQKTLDKANDDALNEVKSTGTTGKIIDAGTDLLKRKNKPVSILLLNRTSVILKPAE